MIEKSWNIKSPAQDVAKTYASEYQLINHGLTSLGTVYWNLPVPALYEEALFRREGDLAAMGPFVVNTGKHTARAANDKFVVRELSTQDNIWWGQYNRPFTPEKFSAVYERLLAYVQGRDLFVQDCYVGADPEYRMPIRVITELAWHSMFARNMFIMIDNLEELKTHVPDFTIISIPSFQAVPAIDGTPSPTFILLNFAQRLAIIGGTGYGGEIKKSVFTILNYLLPLQGVMPMHCSANVGDNGDSALFFGLSGTGKTSLSADPRRHLIGDDEHGWSDNGIFNFEGGCYAKVIRLSPIAEPDIYACTRRFGTILENVIFDPITRQLDLDNDKRTENTRCSYPLDFIDNALPEKRAGHPKNILMLTCDASGVMPPISRLTPEQAVYHFISGYTAKVAGTEIDMGKEPEATFSACFGGPFMVHHPSFYAELLKRKIIKHDVKCWLVNTGWTGGPYGVGKRISIKHTRALLDGALTGALDNVEYYKDEVFGFSVPKTCPNVPDDVMYPWRSWPDKSAYDQKYRHLASLFIENFKKFADGCPPEVAAAGPKI
jgi:phosphoenolpyruvate carboxykinase (ATP)